MKTHYESERQGKIKFIVSYRGEADYQVFGRRYSCRTFACPGTGPTPTSADGYYNGDYYFKGILTAVGTLRTGEGDPHEFPPPEVCALFPDYVPARWNADFSALEYQGEKPATIASKWGDIWAKNLAEDHAKHCGADLESYFQPKGA